MSATLLQEATAIAAELARRQSQRKILQYFPDHGALRRELYPKHLEYFAAGAKYRERLMLAANRIGKTESIGGYEMALHLTGEYPAWWVGRRFDRPTRAWAAGDTSKTVREILQSKMLGKPGEWGEGKSTGLILGANVVRITRSAGTADAVDTITVRHKSGGLSTLTFKSYDQRRESFQGTEVDIIWLDEEPPLDIYTECLLRTMTCGGMVMLTFTPLMGMSEVVLQFLEDGELPTPEKQQTSTSKYVVTATWDDAPHLSDDVKRELWKSIPPYQRDARSKGVPQLGSGAIYPVPETELTVAPFPIPEHWPRGYGQDVGWNWTAGVWIAHDRDNDILYVYRTYKRGQAEPSVHAQAMKAAGEWVPGFIDPAANGRSQHDGEQLLNTYRRLGLLLETADNSVETGLYELWMRMSSGRLKVFASCSEWFSEYRLYRRDDKGRIVKSNDHVMDAMRYGYSRLAKFKTKPAPKLPPRTRGGGGANSWME